MLPFWIVKRLPELERRVAALEERLGEVTTQFMLRFSAIEAEVARLRAGGDVAKCLECGQLKLKEDCVDTTQPFESSIFGPGFHAHICKACIPKSKLDRRTKTKGGK